MKAVPKYDQDRAFGRLLGLLLLVGGLALSAAAGQPAWWVQRGAVLTGSSVASNDFAAANLGQVKNVAAAAASELDDVLPGGAGTGVWSLVSGFGQSHNYAVATLGQLKATARPFYDRLKQDGWPCLLPQGMTTNLAYPWTSTGAQDFAVANLGQLKHVFSFDLTRDTDGDGMPDWWEVKQGLDAFEPSDKLGDADGDGVPNIFAFVYARSNAAPPTLYVDAATAVGVGQQNGTTNAPFATLSQALAVVESNALVYATVRVRPGLYRGSENRDLRVTVPVLIAGVNATGCVIDCESLGPAITFDTSCGSAGLTGVTILRPGGTNDARGVDIGNAVLLSDCRLIGGLAEAETDSRSNGVIHIRGGSSRLQRCSLVGFVGAAGASGVRCDGGSVVLDTCLIAGNDMSGGGAVEVSGTAAVSIVYSTFVQNWGAHSVRLKGAAAAVSVVDSVLWGTGAAEFVLVAGALAGNVTAANSFVRDGCPDGAVVSGVQTDSPRIAPFGVPLSDSLCIDGGIAGRPLGDTDLAGNARGEVPDIGCYEFVSGVNSDEDGVPDTWESACLDTTEYEAWADPNGDGLPLGLEYLMGIEPAHPIQVYTDASGEQGLSWPADAGVDGYQVTLEAAASGGGAWVHQSTTNLAGSTTAAVTFMRAAGSSVRLRATVRGMKGASTAWTRIIEWKSAAAGTEVRAWLLASGSSVDRLLTQYASAIGLLVSRNLPVETPSTWDRFYLAVTPDSYEWPEPGLSLQYRTTDGWWTDYANSVTDLSDEVDRPAQTYAISVGCYRSYRTDDAPGIYLVRWRPSVEVCIE